MAGNSSLMHWQCEGLPNVFVIPVPSPLRTQGETEKKCSKYGKVCKATIVQLRLSVTSDAQ